MSWREFLDVMGLPVPDVNTSPPEDRLARLEANASRLTNTLRRIQHALVRRRRSIEALREGIRRGECAASGHLERDRRLLAQRDSRYQLLLTYHARVRQKLVRIQGKLRAARTARTPR